VGFWFVFKFYSPETCVCFAVAFNYGCVVEGDSDGVMLEDDFAVVVAEKRYQYEQVLECGEDASNVGWLGKATEFEFTAVGGFLECCSIGNSCSDSIGSESDIGYWVIYCDIIAGGAAI
jgi:hypothetical protein